MTTSSDKKQDDKTKTAFLTAFSGGKLVKATNDSQPKADEVENTKSGESSGTVNTKAANSAQENKPDAKNANAAPAGNGAMPTAGDALTSKRKKPKSNILGVVLAMLATSIASKHANFRK